MLWLVVARGFQGIGAGAIFASVFTLIADVFPNAAERARYQGLFFAVFSLSSVIGPIVGGVVTETLGWRWVFYVNVPIGALSLILLPFVLPDTIRNGSGKIDWLGALVSTIGVVSLLLAFTWIGEGQSFTAPAVLITLVLSVIAFALFIPIEQRAVNPIVPLTIFRNRTISAVTVMMFLCSIAMFGIILYTPLYLQGVVGESAATSGAVLIPLVLTMTVVSLIGGQFISRIGRVRPFLIGGAVAVTVGAFLLTTITFSSGLIILGVFMFVVGLGLGLLLPNSTLAVQSTVEPRYIGVATSATQFIRSIGATIGTALMGTLVGAGYTSAMQANLPAGATPALVEAIKHPDALVSENALNALQQASSQVPNGEVVMQALLETARHALANGIHSGFLMVAIASALGILVSFAIPHIDLHKRPSNISAVETELEGLSSIPSH